MSKSPATRMQMVWSESPLPSGISISVDDDGWMPLGSLWERFDQILESALLVARAKDDRKGYIKTGFRIYFEDGESYEGRIDLGDSAPYHRPGRISLAQHMKAHRDFSTSEESWMSEEYKQSLREFWDKHETGLEEE